MCGIAGLVGDYVPGLAARMNAAQKHRGPDGSGIFEDPQAEAAFGHVRLAILDLSEQASQPMVSADGRFVLVYNGEIYNFRELRNELQRAGAPFVSTGDTEVLLRGLMRHGSAFVERLDGMFAFALWDRRERELLLARDPLGIKPLYYAAPQPSSLLFASEIKALCAHPRLTREPDFAAIQQHLTFCHASGDRTAIKGVHRLPPGALLRWSARTRRAEIARYWRPRYRSLAEQTMPRSEGVVRLREAVANATRRQLVSDVPVGSFLSGGLDSSLVTAAAAPEARSGFACYTITFPPEANQLDRMVEDAPYARHLAARLRLPLYDVPIGPQSADLWPKLIHFLDEPIADPAAITCYLLSRLARDHGTKVLLSGQGADELFAGYPRYQALRAARFADALPRALVRGAGYAAQLLPGARSGQLGALLRRGRRVLHSLGSEPDERFLAWCAGSPPASAARVLSADVRAQLGAESGIDECLRQIRAGALPPIDSYLDRDLSVYLPNHNLLYTDKMGMAVGVETRVPLLGNEVVQLGTSLPWQWKLIPDTKAILRDAARGVIPDRLIDRPKAGFGAPYRQWLRGDLAPLWNELTSPASLRARGWFDPAALTAVREESQAGRNDLYLLQWAVLTLELWARQFLDANPAPAEQTPHDPGCRTIRIPSAA